MSTNECTKIHTLYAKVSFNKLQRGVDIAENKENNKINWKMIN